MAKRSTPKGGIQPGDVIECSVCGEEHVLKRSTAQETSAKDFLYAVCTKPATGRYHVGSIGGSCNRGRVIRRAYGN